jgi:hypothetical protein
MDAKLLACVVAGTLLIPAAAFGKDGNTLGRPPSSGWKSAGALRLPPIPYRETIHWLSTEAIGPTQKVDQLLGPDLDMLKFALDKDAVDDALFLDASASRPYAAPGKVTRKAALPNGRDGSDAIPLRRCRPTSSRGS